MRRADRLQGRVNVEVLDIALELLVSTLQVKERLRNTNTRAVKHGARSLQRLRLIEKTLWYLRDGVLELGRLETLVLLDLLPRRVHGAFFLEDGG